MLEYKYLMSSKQILSRTGRIATLGKHNDGFLFVGVLEDDQSPDLAKFFYLLEINSPWINGEEFKSAVVSPFENLKPKDLADGKLDLFEQQIKLVNLNLATLAAKDNTDWKGKINGIVGLISNNEILFSQTGDIGGYLFRQNKISQITEKPEAEDFRPNSVFISIISGKVAARDKVVIANQRFYQSTPLDRLRAIFNQGDLHSWVEAIAKNLKASKNKISNSLIFHFIDSENAENEIVAEPPIIILDEIIESPFSKSAKKFYHRSRELAKRFHIAMRDKVVPKLASGAKTLGKNTKIVGSAAFKPVVNKIGSTPKINHFNDKVGKRSARNIGHFFSNLVYWSKELIKPQNRKYLYISIVVILLIIGFFKIQANKKNGSNIASDQQKIADLNNARDLYSKAIDDIGLEKTGGKDELISAKNLATSALGNNATNTEAENLLKQINTKLDSLNATKRISSGTNPTFNLSASPFKIFASGAELYYFTSDGKIAKFDTRSNAETEIATIQSADGKITAATYSDSQSAFYIKTDKNKIYQLTTDSGDLAEKTVENGNWGNSISLANYLGNLYFLNTENEKIVKYTEGSNNYLTGVDYYSGKSNLNVGADIIIDGNVYVVKNDGAILKISKGKLDSAFAVSGLPTPDDTVKSTNKVYTSSDSNSIFIFDNDLGRVIEYSKTGSYKRQFTADNSLKLTNFAVNNKLKKIWLISDSKVFEQDL